MSHKLANDCIYDRNQSKVNCDDDLELQILWIIPMSEFPLDEFVSWRWEIKWSEIQTLNIHLKIQKGRIPYIKLGIYNADGSPKRFSYS